MPQSKLAFISCILFIVLSLRFFFFFTNLPVYNDGDNVKYSTGLQEEPRLTGRGQQFSIKDPAYNTIFIRTNAKQIYHYGEVLRIEGRLHKSKYQGRDELSLSYPYISVERERDNIFTGLAETIRERSKSIFESTLPPVSASLLLGIVFGTKQQFPNDFLKHLRIVGVLHVIAASGMNISFVAGAIMFSLGALFKRQISISVTIFAVIFYSVLVGFEPSILRAAIMAIIGFTASLFGRQKFAIFSLFLTALFMLFWQPGFIFDLGFQLSFISTIGILTIKPLLESGMGRIPKLLGEDFTTTTSAQIATVPVMLSVFGNYGILSIFVNALVLWTIPLLMVLGSLAVISSFVFAPLAKIFLFFSYPFLLLFERLVDFFGKSGWVVRTDNFPITLSVGYYLLLISIVLLTKRKAQNAKVKTTMQN